MIPLAVLALVFVGLEGAAFVALLDALAGRPVVRAVALLAVKLALFVAFVALVSSCSGSDAGPPPESCDVCARGGDVGPPLLAARCSDGAVFAFLASSGAATLAAQCATRGGVQAGATMPAPCICR